MPLQAVVQTLDEVPDSWRGFYVPRDGGGFYIDIDPDSVNGLPLIKNLKAEHEKEKVGRRELRVAVAEIEELAFEEGELVRKYNELKAAGNAEDAAAVGRRLLEGREKMRALLTECGASEVEPPQEDEPPPEKVADPDPAPVENPFLSEHWNKTKQAKLIRQDREIAAKLAHEAGFMNLERAFSAKYPRQRL